MLTTISNSIIPLVIFAVVLYGCIKKTNVYEDFIDGAFDGMKIVVELVPTLIGLFVAVRILNDSGALGLITTALKPIASLTYPGLCDPRHYNEAVLLRVCHQSDAKYL